VSTIWWPTRSKSSRERSVYKLLIIDEIGYLPLGQS
jgi:DNA replication protein DnaC